MPSHAAEAKNRTFRCQLHLASCLSAYWLISGCAADSPRTMQTGALSAELRLPNGLEIEDLDYRVTRGEQLVRAGSVDLRSSSSPNFRVGALPLAAGYHLQLTAVALLRDVQPARGVPCSGEADFAIDSTAVTPLALTLSCADIQAAPDTAGDLRTNVNVVVEPEGSCPVITGIEALPMQGSSMRLTGFTSSETLVGSLNWAAASGAFSNPFAAATTFTCDRPGEVPVTFWLTPSAARCPVQSSQVSLDCTQGAPPACPDGWWDHDANPLTPCVQVEAHSLCPPQPQPGGLAAVNLACNYGTECCCGSCSPSIICSAQAGQRLICSYTEACFMPTCTNSSACNACRDQHCRGADTFGVDVVAGCLEQVQTSSPVGDPATFLQDCRALVTCESAAGCGVDGQFLWQCYCGEEASIEACFETGPTNAMCLPHWQQAMRTSDPIVAEQRITNLGYPSGWAFQLLQCQASFCSDVCL